MRKVKCAICDKSALVCSNAALGKKLAALCQSRGIPIKYVREVRDLGLGFIGGRRRGTKTQQARLAKAHRRGSRVAKLAQIDRRAKRLHTTGTLPAATYGVASIGAAPTHLQKLRSLTARAAGIGGGRNCIATTIALTVGTTYDPAVHIPCLIFQARMEIWRQHADVRYRLSRAFNAAKERLLKARKPWSIVSGPIMCLIQTLRDLSWEPLAADCWRDSRGNTWQLTDEGSIREPSTSSAMRSPSRFGVRRPAITAVRDSREVSIAAFSIRGCASSVVARRIPMVYS